MNTSPRRWIMLLIVLATLLNTGVTYALTRSAINEARLMREHVDTSLKKLELEQIRRDAARDFSEDFNASQQEAQKRWENLMREGNDRFEGNLREQLGN